MRKRPIHSFKRKTASTLTIDNGTDTTTSFEWKLNDLPDYTEFTNLFDSYRINAIKLEIKPRFNNVDATAPGMVPIYTVIDHNDNTYLTSTADALQYETCKVHKMTQGVKRYLKVNALGSSQTTGGAAIGEQLWRKWFSTSQADILHYGVKLWAPATSFEEGIVYDVITTYYFQCKAVF